MSITLSELGLQVRMARLDRSLSQEDLASQLSPRANRSAIAHLEQGLRLPVPDALQAICIGLGIPTPLWKPFLSDAFKTRLEFEAALSEFAGRRLSLRALDDASLEVAERAVVRLFDEDMQPTQSYDAFNSVLLFYGMRPATRSFFDRYLGPDAMRTPTKLREAAGKYQTDAIRLFATFSEAYEVLNQRDQDLSVLLAPLGERPDGEFLARTPWSAIAVIPNDRLADLGYLSAQAEKLEQAERDALASFLRELADELAKNPGALARHGEKKRRRMDSRLRKFNSNLKHGLFSPLFAPDPDELRREADLVLGHTGADGFTPLS